MTSLRGLSLFSAIGLAVVAQQCVEPLQSAYAGDFIRCESVGDRYRFCRARTRGRVRIDRRLSDARCDLGRTWGYERDGVWVRDGCRAVFEIGGYRPYYRDDYDSYDDRRDRDDDKGFSNGETAAIALGALVGGAVLGSLANQNSAGSPPQPPPQNSRPPSYQTGSPDGSGGFAYEHDYERGRVPSWLVGQFQGQSAVYRTPLQLTVYSDGTAFIGSGKTRDEGAYRNGQIEIAGRSYTVSQQGSGVTLREVNNARNELRFTRVY